MLAARGTNATVECIHPLSLSDPPLCRDSHHGRKLDVAAQQHSSALEACSRDNATASTATRERLSRVEAEHALALRENGKASVRQRALERELARIKERYVHDRRSTYIFIYIYF